MTEREDALRTIRQWETDGLLHPSWAKMISRLLRQSTDANFDPDYRFGSFLNRLEAERSEDRDDMSWLLDVLNGCHVLDEQDDIERAADIAERIGWKP